MFPTSPSNSMQDWFSASQDRSWSLGGRVEIPIGNRTARHRSYQAAIELRRSRTRLRREEQTVTLEVRDAARNLASAIEGIQAAERRRVAQEDSLRAEQERLRLGDSTPFQVLQFEEDLAEAEREEIFALQTFRNSVTAIERAQGNLLQARGIDYRAILER